MNPAIPDPESNAKTIKVLIIHEVADYAAWKRVFDDAAGMRKRAGEIRYRRPVPVGQHNGPGGNK